MLHKYITRVTLRGNVAALCVLQVANYVVPVITLPYLTRVLGAEVYGKIAFIQALMAYFQLLTDYGFTWSATRKISANRVDRVFVSDVFVHVWFAQWLLVLLSAGLITIFIVGYVGIKADALLYATAFLVVPGNVLFPVWFFQGMEHLRDLAVIQVVTKLAALIPIFTLVNTPSDAIWVLAISGGTSVLCGVLSIYWIRKLDLVDWHWPALRIIRREFIEGGPLFGSRLAISCYTTLVPLALGWIAGPVAVGYFSLADKLRTAIQSLLAPLSQALFPRMSLLFASETQAAIGLLKQSGLIVLTIAGGAGIALWTMADWLVISFGGPEFAPAAVLVRWLACLPLVIGLSNLLGVQLMLPKQLNRPFNFILIGAGLIGLSIVWPLIGYFHAIGAALTMLITELFVTASMSIYVWKWGHLSPVEKCHT